MANCCEGCFNSCYKYLWLILGPIMVFGLYLLLGLHVYTCFVYLFALLGKRIGSWQSICWEAIGLVILYNIIYNHILATIVKPNGPRDLRKVEKLREIYKQRVGRKFINLEDKTTEDRFEGVSKDVKKLLRYRHKTMD